MPKRSNKFQRLVFLLQHQIAGEKVVVTESKMMTDRVTGELAEVDVAVEFEMNGFPVIMGFEVRDTNRKIDRNAAFGIVAKYRRLVDKIIIVSKAGFTRGALKHCKISSADAITFREASTVDWGAFLDAHKDLCFATFDFQVSAGPTVTYQTVIGRPPPSNSTSVEIIDAAGTKFSLDTAVTSMIRAFDAGRIVMDEWMAKPKPERERNFTRSLTFTPKTDSPMFMEQAGIRYRVESITVPIRVCASDKQLGLSPMKFADRRVLHGSVTLDEGGLAGKEVLVAISEGAQGLRSGAILVPSNQGQTPAVHKMAFVPNALGTTGE